MTATAHSIDEAVDRADEQDRPDPRAPRQGDGDVDRQHHA